MQKLVIGENDLLSLFPNNAAEWHPTKNTKILSSVMYASRYNAWWICKKKHEWQVKVSSRTNYLTGCPYCSGNRVLVGFNDLSTTHAQLANEWHPTKNGGLKPEEVSNGSGRKIFWIGKCGHTWEQAIVKRTRNDTGCPYCCGQRALKNFNDLTTTHPQIAAEWHPTKNNMFTLETISYGSSKKPWWQCDKGHEWEATVRHRTISLSACPYCANKKVLVGFNDLATMHPGVAAEWHPTKNGEIFPEQFTRGSSKKAWWKCDKKHEWEAAISSRSSRGSGCPICSNNGTSNIEKEFRDYFNNHFSEINKSASVKSKISNKWFQLDIVGNLYGKKVVIEYDGSHWHSSEEVLINDQKKTMFLLENEYIVVRIREKHHIELPSLNIDHPNYYEIKYVFKQPIEPIANQILEYVKYL